MATNTAAKAATAATAPGAAPGASAMRPIKLRNAKRTCWFFRFPVTDEVAAIARGEGVGLGGEDVPIVGLKVENGEKRARKGGKVSVTETAICTLALGEAQAKTELGDLTPELVLPGEVWAALLADETQGPVMRGLIDKNEIAWSPDVGGPSAVAA
jgi:hypothetical protein